jgi:twitching motility protein PilT
LAKVKGESLNFTEACVAATATAPIQVLLDPVSAGAGTDELLAAMLRANPRISDLIFSPGRGLQVQINGHLVAVESSVVTNLTTDDTRRMASQLIGNNKAAIAMLREQGYCDVSYALPGVARFRVNVFIQRGSCAVVMRVIPTTIPTLSLIGAPPEFHQIASLRDGLALVTGPRGSGKSYTLAALVDEINETTACHILTIEDPIEFLHLHKRATVHQRELHSDTPSIGHAMRAALRQAPNVIVVGELKDRETMELALEAAETGHLVLSTLTTREPEKALERLVGTVPTTEQQAVRDRLGRMLRLIVCQRLVPRCDGDRVAVFEVSECNTSSFGLERDARTMRMSLGKGAARIDSELERLVRSGVIAQQVALLHAVDPGSLSAKLATHSKPRLR